MKWNTRMATVIPRTCVINGIEIDLAASDVYGSRITILEIPGVWASYSASEYFVYDNGKLYRFYEYIPNDITDTIQGKEAIKKIKSANLGKYLCEYRCARRIEHDHEFTATQGEPFIINEHPRPGLLLLDERTIVEVSHPYRRSIFCKSHIKINKKFFIELDNNIIVKHDDLHKKVVFNIVPDLWVIANNEELSLNEKANKITDSILWSCFETIKVGECYATTKSWVLNNIVYPHRRGVLKRRLTI